MSNWWKLPFFIWKLQSKSLPQITLLGSVAVNEIFALKCTTTIYNTSNGGLPSGISAFVQLLAQVIKNIFVCNFLYFSCIWNPIYARLILSSALYSPNVKLVKTTILGIEITIAITTSNNVTRACATTIYNTADGALTSGTSALVQPFVQIINNIFVPNFLFSSSIRNPT